MRNLAYNMGRFVSLKFPKKVPQVVKVRWRCVLWVKFRRIWTENWAFLG
jgi:hypothetical protein